MAIVHGGLNWALRNKIWNSFSASPAADHTDNPQIPSAQFPSAQFLFSTMKVGGTGLNLTRANSVFIVEPGISVNHEKQSLGRVHREGQLGPTKLRLIHCTNNPAEKIVLNRRGLRQDTDMDSLFATDGGLE